MDSDSNNFVIAAGNDVEYKYYRIQGDGSCFIHCYLDAFYPKYNELSSRDKNILARKTRIDFANFLMGESSKSKEEIIFNLNIIGFDYMFYYLVNQNGKYVRDTLEEIAINFKNGEYTIEESLDLISLLDLIIVYPFENVPGTLENLIVLYSRDPRYNYTMSVVKRRSLGKTAKQATKIYEDAINEFGIGDNYLPINIGLYEICEFLPDISTIEESINRLIDPSAYLEHFESTLFSKYIGVNTFIFQVGNGYSEILNNTQPIEGKLSLLMINIGNNHWNLISCSSDGGPEQLVNCDYDEITLNLLLKKLTFLYENYTHIF